MLLPGSVASAHPGEYLEVLAALQSIDSEIALIDGENAAQPGLTRQPDEGSIGEIAHKMAAASNQVKGAAQTLSSYAEQTSAQSSAVAAAAAGGSVSAETARSAETVHSHGVLNLAGCGAQPSGEATIAR